MALSAKIITGAWRKTLGEIDERHPPVERRTMDDVASEIEILERELVNITGEMHRTENCLADKRTELSEMVKQYGIKVL